MSSSGLSWENPDDTPEVGCSRNPDSLSYCAGLGACADPPSPCSPLRVALRDQLQAQLWAGAAAGHLRLLRWSRDQCLRAGFCDLHRPESPQVSVLLILAASDASLLP